MPGSQLPRIEYPTPANDPIMRALFEAVVGWKERHNISEGDEAVYLACLLAGRLHVRVSLEAVRALPDLYPSPDGA